MTLDEIKVLWGQGKISIGSSDPEKYIFKEGYVYVIMGSIGLDKREYLLNELKGKFVSTSVRITAEPKTTPPKTLYGFEFKEDALLFKMFWGNK